MVDAGNKIKYKAASGNATWLLSIATDKGNGGPGRIVSNTSMFVLADYDVNSLNSGDEKKKYPGAQIKHVRNLLKYLIIAYTNTKRGMGLIHFFYVD